mmetsp:Transcript_26271/g.4533  ORF Transcript_26271/g.4533 Transcript_26271/m.4533 type:complete len:83 (+) Transcript_26271:1189-1437(+)
MLRCAEIRRFELKQHALDRFKNNDRELEAVVETVSSRTKHMNKISTKKKVHAVRSHRKPVAEMKKKLESVAKYLVEVNEKRK